MQPSRQSPRPWLWPLALFAVFLIALVWRLAYLGRLARTPFETSLTMDARIYWDWAGYLLREGPVGKNPFFMGPLYPYVLTALRGAFGDVHSVLVVQAVWGAAAVAFLADAAKRLAGPAIGIAIGVLLAFYRMGVFLDGLVLMESLLFALEALLLWIVVRSAAPGWRTALAIGAIVGALAEGRATAALLLVPAAWLLMETAGREGRARGVRLAALAGGFLLLVTPAAVRNLAVSGEWIPFTYNSGFNLAVGNGPEANGGFALATSQIASPVPEDGGIEGDGREYIQKSTGRALGPNASSAWWADQALSWMRAHPGAAAGLVVRRLGMMWNRREYPQIENAAVYETVAGPLGLPFATFAVLGVLAIAGIPFAWRHGPAGRFLVGYVAATTVAILPFFVTDRYRHHLVPAAALLAAIALEQAWRAMRARGGAQRLAIGGALAAGLVIVNLPAPNLSGAKQAWGAAFDIGTRWMEQGRPDLAIPQYERALEMERKGTVKRLPGVAAAVERASLYYDYARALRLVGRERDALPWLERAVNEAPEAAPQLAALADALHRAGRESEAAAIEQRLARVSGGAGRVLLAQGWRAATGGNTAAAESLFAAATRSDPSLFDAWTASVRIQVERGELSAARSTLDRARQAGLPAVQYHAHAALVLAAQGDVMGANAELDALPSGIEQGDPILAEVVRMARSLTTPRSRP